MLADKQYSDKPRLLWTGASNHAGTPGIADEGEFWLAKPIAHNGNTWARKN